MKIARFNLNGEIRFGSVVGDQVSLFEGNPFESKALSGESIALDQIQLLAPVAPSKIICIGMNYAAHAAEISQDVPDEPLMFFKPISAIIGPNDTIVLPHQSDQVLHTERARAPRILANIVRRVQAAAPGPPPQRQGFIAAISWKRAG